MLLLSPAKSGLLGWLYGVAGGTFLAETLVVTGILILSYKLLLSRGFLSEARGAGRFCMTGSAFDRVLVRILLVVASGKFDCCAAA